MRSKPEDFHVFTEVSIESKPCCGPIQKHHKLLNKKGQNKERRILLPRERAKYIYTYIPQSEDEADGRWQSSITTGNRLK
jgi:hypothetical protein